MNPGLLRLDPLLYSAPLSIQKDNRATPREDSPEISQLAHGLEGGVEGSAATKLSEARTKKPSDPAKSLAMSGKLAVMTEILLQVCTHPMG